MALGSKREWRIVPGQRLSSLLTFTHKFVFPTIWLGGFGLGTALLVIDPPRDGPSPLLFVAALIVGAAMFFRWGFSLKKVTAAEGGLVVSNYRRKVFVSYGQISSVRENKWINSRPISVELRSPTALGSSFVFVPYWALVLWSDHPLATFLREQASAARRAVQEIG